MSSIISDTVFEMISDPKGINLSLGENPRMFQRVYFKDSLLRFYPYGEVFINDKQGIIVSTYTFIEGMKFATKFGSPELTVTGDTNNKTKAGYLVHDYAWSESQVAGTVRDSDYLSGVNQFFLISNFFFKDFVKTKAYKKQPSDIAKDIAQKVFGITDSTKLHIDTTNNEPTNIWYQGNRTNKDFIEQTLVKNAHASSVPDSEKIPFVSFINCAGEFYFCSYATLYKQTPVATYTAKLALDKVTDPFAIQEITFLCGGAPLNRGKHKQNIHTLDEKGTQIVEEILLSNNYLKRDTKDKYPVNKQNVDQINTIRNLGLFETGDEYLRPARETFLYQDSCMAFRICIVIYFNPKVIAGKVVNINIKKFTENNRYATELSGNWLVIESEHVMGINNVIFSKITLAKPSIPFNNEWSYSANVI